MSNTLKLVPPEGQFIKHNDRFSVDTLPSFVQDTDVLSEFVNSVQQLKLFNLKPANPHPFNQVQSVLKGLIVKRSNTEKSIQIDVFKAPELLRFIKEDVPILIDRTMDELKESPNKPVSDNVVRFKQAYKKLDPLLNCLIHSKTDWSEEVEDESENERDQASEGMDVSPIPCGQGSPKSSQSDLVVDLSINNPISPVIPITESEEVTIESTPNIDIDIDNIDLRDNYGNPNYQFSQRKIQMVRKHVNNTRQNHIKRLQTQFKGTQGTCVIFSKQIESQSSQEMSDNAWLSLRRYGLSNDEFVIAEANSPYLALVSFHTTECMMRVLSEQKFTHHRYVGNEGKTVTRGELFIQDLRVNREEFTVTGADFHSWEQTKDAFVLKYEDMYPGVKINVRRGYVVMRTEMGEGQIEEIERQTSTMEVVVESPTDQVFNFITGTVTLTIAEGVRRELNIVSKGWSGKCRKCGGAQDDCRREVDGEVRWACKDICYFCHLPISTENHNEDTCKQDRDNNPREFANKRRVNQAWWTACKEYERKAVNLEKPGAKEQISGRNLLGKTAERFCEQVNVKIDESKRAAIAVESPFETDWQETGAKIHHAKKTFAEMAREHQTNGRSPTGKIHFRSTTRERAIDTNGRSIFQHRNVDKQLDLLPPLPKLPRIVVAPRNNANMSNGQQNYNWQVQRGGRKKV